MNLRKSISILILAGSCILAFSSLSATATGPSGFSTFLPWIEPAYIPPSALDIIYTGSAEGNMDVYLIQADGTNLRRVTNDATEEREPAASYDGSRYIFVSDRDGNHDLYALTVETDAVERLTTDLSDDRYPTYSPDGEKIAFLSNRESTTDTYHIYIANADGSNPIRLSEVPATEGYGWSPDSTKIAFVEINSTRIHVAAVAGDTPLIIEPDLSGYSLPQLVNVNWSGSGETLVFGGIYNAPLPNANNTFALKILADGSTNTVTFLPSCGLPITGFDHPYILCPNNLTISGEERGYFVVTNSRPRTEVLWYGSTATVHRDPRWVP